MAKQPMKPKVDYNKIMATPESRHQYVRAYVAGYRKKMAQQMMAPKAKVAKGLLGG